MRLFKRISSSVLASVDKVVSEVENHDAVVESMLKELKHAAADAKVRLKRVHNDGKKLKQRLQAVDKDEVKWQQRAELSVDSDEEKALACLQRRKQCQTEQSKIQERLKDHRLIEEKLSSQLKGIEDRYNEINHKRHLLQSKQALADANRVVMSVTGIHSEGFDEAFDRWELKIAKAEIGGDSFSINDSDELFEDELSIAFDKADADAELLNELDALKQSSKSSTSAKSKQ